MGRSVTAKLNPEFVRGLRISLPPRRAAFAAALVLAVTCAGGWLLWNTTHPPLYRTSWMTEGELQEALANQTLRFGRTSVVGLTTALFGLLFILAPAAAGLSFVQERLRGTAVFQQMSLLSPFRLAAGKFLGSGFLAYFIAALLVPFALAAAWVGEAGAGKVTRLYLFLLVGGLCWQAVGLFVSSLLSGPDEKPLRGGLLVGPAVAVCAAITALALNQFFVFDQEELRRAYEQWPGDYEYTYHVEQGRYWWHFFGARVPAYAVILGLLSFAGAWAFAGSVRRIKVWQLIPVRPAAGWLFFASAETLLVGLLWGRHADDTVPNERLTLYLALNWAALALLAGSGALTRGRLREWWSAERDPLAVFQREEIKNTFKTFLAALFVAEAGLAALWWSYHIDPLGNRFDFNLGSQLLPIAACFALTVLGMAAFVQYCAAHRFRIGGWAGVGLLFLFYVFTTLAGGLMFARLNNTPALLNPLVYAEVVTKGDYFMDSRFNTRFEDVAGSSYRRRVVPPTDYEVNAEARYDPGEAAAHGLAAEGLLAALCFGLAYVKLRRIRGEMLREGGRAAPTFAGGG